jgi:DNA repair protein RecO (recombination protein O)
VRENEPVGIYRDDGIVLRTQKLGEADRIVTLLARRAGRVRAVAKGVRRTKSRFGARLEPFTHVDLLLYTGRSLDVITQADTVRPYGKPFASDYPRYTAGTAMLETAEKFTPVEKEPAMRQFLLLVGGLRALGEGVHDPRLVLDAYLLRSLAVAGFAPALDECAVCGTRVAEARGAASGVHAAAGSGASGSGPWGSGGIPREAAVPGGTVPGGTVPGGTVPGGTVPGGAVPGGAVPGGAVPPRASTALRGFAFSIGSGGLVCADCRAAGAATPSAATILLMSALMRGDWAHADGSDRGPRAECSGLVAAYLQWHLEHAIRSLRHVERG